MVFLQRTDIPRDWLTILFMFIFIFLGVFLLIQILPVYKEQKCKDFEIFTAVRYLLIVTILLIAIPVLFIVFTIVVCKERKELGIAGIFYPLMMVVIGAILLFTGNNLKNVSINKNCKSANSLGTQSLWIGGVLTGLSGVDIILYMYKNYQERVERGERLFETAPERRKRLEEAAKKQQQQPIQQQPQPIQQQPQPIQQQPQPIQQQPQPIQQQVRFAVPDQKDVEMRQLLNFDRAKDQIGKEEEKTKQEEKELEERQKDLRKRKELIKKQTEKLKKAEEAVKEQKKAQEEAEKLKKEYFKSRMEGLPLTEELLPVLSDEAPPAPTGSELNIHHQFIEKKKTMTKAQKKAIPEAEKEKIRNITMKKQAWDNYLNSLPEQKRTEIIAEYNQKLQQWRQQQQWQPQQQQQPPQKWQQQQWQPQQQQQPPQKWQQQWQPQQQKMRIGDAWGN